MIKKDRPSTNRDIGISWKCPACGAHLRPTDLNSKSCPKEGVHYYRVDGIWRFLLPEREVALRSFIQDYETVREQEQRGSLKGEYYRALPFSDSSCRFAHEWRIRAKSYRVFLRNVLQPVENEKGDALRVLDLGAGNGWMSNRVAEQGHFVVAVDLLVNQQDGLGTHHHYSNRFVPVQAEFDHLPFGERQFSLIVFNASFHYSVSYERTLASVIQLLEDEGKVVILDSPIYRDESSGRQMVNERENEYLERFGCSSNSLPSENFLTFARLEELSSSLGLRWELIKPFYGLAWHSRFLKARVRGRREPARFHLIVGNMV